MKARTSGSADPSYGGDSALWPLCCHLLLTGRYYNTWDSRCHAFHLYPDGRMHVCSVTTSVDRKENL
ncbi:hypothetical protein INR49_010355, partial [Caranx melampygus]